MRSPTRRGAEAGPTTVTSSTCTTAVGWRRPSTLTRLDVTAPPTPVLEGIVSPTSTSLERPLYTVSNAGQLAYVPGASTIQGQLVWVDRGGRARTGRKVRELSPILA